MSLFQSCLILMLGCCLVMIRWVFIHNAQETKKNNILFYTIYKKALQNILKYYPEKSQRNTSCLYFPWCKSLNPGLVMLKLKALTRPYVAVKLEEVVSHFLTKSN